MRNFTLTLIVAFCLLGLLLMTTGISAVAFAFIGIGAVLSFIILAQYFGYWRAIAISLIFIVLPSLVLIIQQKTGYPFSNFQFTPLAGLEITPGLPIIVPFFGLVLLVSGLFFCRYIIISALKGSLWYNYYLILSSALMLFAFALIILPAFTSQSYIVWSSPGRFYGVPGLSLIGWLLTALLSYLAATKLYVFKINANPFYIKTASLMFVILVIYAGLICLQAGYYLPFSIGAALVFVYLVQKYNFYKRKLLSPAI